MPDLRQTRKNIKTALAVLLGVDVVALVVLIFAARGLERFAASGTEPVVERIADKNSPGRAADESGPESDHGEPADRGLLQETLPCPGLANFHPIRQAGRRQRSDD